MLFLICSEAAFLVMCPYPSQKSVPRYVSYPSPKKAFLVMFPIRPKKAFLVMFPIRPKKTFLMLFPSFSNGAFLVLFPICSKRMFLVLFPTQRSSCCSISAFLLSEVFLILFPICSKATLLANVYPKAISFSYSAFPSFCLLPSLWISVCRYLFGGHKQIIIQSNDALSSRCIFWINETSLFVIWTSGHNIVGQNLGVKCT